MVRPFYIVVLIGVSSFAMVWLNTNSSLVHCQEVSENDQDLDDILIRRAKTYLLLQQARLRQSESRNRRIPNSVTSAELENLKLNVVLAFPPQIEPTIVRESPPGDARKGFFQMKRTRHTTEQIIEKLRKADVALGQGQKVPEVCKQLEITEQTYYRWRQKYGGMAPEMAKQLRALEKENARLKKLVAEQALDMEILKEAAKGNW
jgi:putative transposase